MGRRYRMTGLSLVELMIALVMGVLVVGAVATFTVSSVKAYAENMNSSRMTRDLRTSMTLAVRELRRAGYDDASVTRALSSTAPTKFSVVTVDPASQCLLYQYDRNEGAPGDAPTGSENRGIRRNAATNALEFSTGTTSCTAGTWVPISDPAALSISKFSPKLVESSYCQPVSTVHDAAAGTFTFTYGLGRVRVVQLCLKGKSARDGGIERFITDSVRIRAEAPQFMTKVVTSQAAAVCSAVESGGMYVNGVLDTTATLPESPAKLAEDCAK